MNKRHYSSGHLGGNSLGEFALIQILDKDIASERFYLDNNCDKEKS